MKVFVNSKIKELFVRMLLCMLLFFLILLAAAAVGPGAPLLLILFVFPCMAAAVLVLCYGYFREQNAIMEDAVTSVREYISGRRDSRIECDEEGELYRLFHEVNSLAAILNAQAENEARTKKFLKNTMSDISHQLKTPLAALNIYNGIIQAEAEANALQTVGEFADLSDRELERIETLVQNLLKIAKFDAGAIVMEKNAENISEMMEEVRRHFAFRAEREGKELVFCGAQTLSFFCDRSWIAEAVGNLVKNALDHTEAGDWIRVEWGQSASVIRITVADNGSGIQTEDLHHIFKRFYRSRYSKDTQGAGLGLPLAKAVAEAHNGTIEVDSWPGRGTTFAMNFLIPTKL